jgi:hypothetical protein
VGVVDLLQQLDELAGVVREHDRRPPRAREGGRGGGVAQVAQGVQRRVERVEDHGQAVYIRLL